MDGSGSDGRFEYIAGLPPCSVSLFDRHLILIMLLRIITQSGQTQLPRQLLIAYSAGPRLACEPPQLNRRVSGVGIW